MTHLASLFAAMGADVKQEQIEYQRKAYDRHYPKMAAAIRDQLGHPMLSGYYDRLAERVLDLGVTGTARPDGQPYRFFEAGSGEGLVATAVQRVARRRGIRFAYTGTDLSEAAIDIARTVVDGDLAAGDATQLVAEMEPASQDLIWAKNLLHHLADPAEFVRHAARAVGPTGRVVIIEPRLRCPVHWVNLMWFRQERFLWSGYGRTLAAFGAAGVEVLRVEPYSMLPFELALATRLRWPRRLLGTSNPAVLERAAAADEWVSRTFPSLALYRVSALTPGPPGEPRPT
ncbi:MAG: class I SAM-dependent methyltransferase [Actinomycetota bacterium]